MPKSLSVEDVAKHMLALLPPDGTPVLNRVMRVMLTRDMHAMISPELFFAARDALLKSEHIGRSRGQGGYLFLAPKTESIAPPAKEAGKEQWSEAKLMPSLEKYLRGPFLELQDLPKDSVSVVLDTSRMGPLRGRWARPDFIFVTAARLKYLPGAQVDVHSFELKTERGADDLAVYEALAQTRFTHYGHLVWHLPENSKENSRLAEIEAQCIAHGVGLILMRDPDQEESCEIVLDPVRKPTLPLAVDGFLESRLKGVSASKKLAALVNGASP